MLVTGAAGTVLRRAERPCHVRAASWSTSPQGHGAQPAGRACLGGSGRCVWTRGRWAEEAEPWGQRMGSSRAARAGSQLCLSVVRGWTLPLNSPPPFLLRLNGDNNSSSSVGLL